MQICKILIVTVTFLILSGCAMLPIYPEYNEGQKGIIATAKDAWNYDTSKDPIDWKQQAEFYASNYPDSTDAEKVKMITDAMTKQKDKFTTSTKIYTIVATKIYDNKGIQIWPVSNIEPRGAGQLSKFADTMQELDESISPKKQSAELDNLEKQVEKQDDSI